MDLRSFFSCSPCLLGAAMARSRPRFWSLGLGLGEELLESFREAVREVVEVAAFPVVPLAIAPDQPDVGGAVVDVPVLYPWNSIFCLTVPKSMGFAMTRG